mgnify:CR=1 FL=1|tara:strand:+ start:2270 stop:2482 length:213 start_codon:yes stop_codon:yes gene_type:complete
MKNLEIEIVMQYIENEIDETYKKICTEKQSKEDVDFFGTDLLIETKAYNVGKFDTLRGIMRRINLLTKNI